LFQDLNGVSGRQKAESVHLSRFPKMREELIDEALEERMELAQKISSMVLSIRKKENIRVRQPLNTIQIPVTGNDLKNKIEAVKELILSEVNVKNIEFVDESQTRIVKNLKLNFKTLGKKCGKDMKEVQAHAATNSAEIIRQVEAQGHALVQVAGSSYQLDPEDVEIIPVDIPGWKVVNSGALTVALDTVITPALKEEGIARELVNRIQNLRKDKSLEVTDKITLQIQEHDRVQSAILNNLNYICTETLAVSLVSKGPIDPAGADLVDVDEEIRLLIKINKA
jgi:isoleucyl-tRNA synthetase